MRIRVRGKLKASHGRWFTHNRAGYLLMMRNMFDPGRRGIHVLSMATMEKRRNWDEFTDSFPKSQVGPINLVCFRMRDVRIMLTRVCK